MFFKEKDEIYDRKKEISRIVAEERRKGQQDIIEWLIRQNEYNKFARNFRIDEEIKARDIYEVDFGINVNCEFSYRHYALVLADSASNNPLVLVCPLKTNFKGAHPSSDLNIGYIDEIESKYETLAVINQIRVIDKIRIFKKSVIGKYQDRYNEMLSDSDDSLEITKYRLDEYRFSLVIESVKNYLDTGKITK